jgi:hypothetical protein
MSARKVDFIDVVNCVIISDVFAPATRETWANSEEIIISFLLELSVRAWSLVQRVDAKPPGAHTMLR